MFAAALLLQMALPSLFTPWRAYPFLAAALLAGLFGGIGPGLVALTLANVALAWALRHVVITNEVAQILMFDLLSLALLAGIERYRRIEAEALAVRRSLLAQIETERKRLENIISSVPGVVWEAWGQPDAATQRIDFVSEHVTRMLGYTVAEWLAQPNFWLSIVHPEDRERAAASAHAHFERGGNEYNEFRWMAKDGRAIWVAAHSTIINDADGKPVGMRGVTMDISSRKRAEESVRFLARASEVLASSLDYETTITAAAKLALPTLADMSIVDLIDADGGMRRIAAIHADPAKQALADRIKSYPPSLQGSSASAEALRSGTPVVLNHGFDADIAVRAPTPEHASAVRELGIRSYLAVPMQARGRTLGALVFCSATENRYDEITVELCVLLARRAAIAVDNAQLYRASVEAGHAKDEFLATVSHELRTPMTSTLGWVRMLQMVQLDEATRKTALEAIERSTRAQALIIDDILDVSSIILGKFRLDLTEVDLVQTVEAAVEALQPAIDAKKMKIAIDTAGYNGAIRGDGARLQQVLWNLISNAIKFGQENGRIEVVLRSGEERVTVSVCDDGIGIDPAFLPHVFERFRQGETGTTRGYGGLGLGLAIVRHLVELHGGRVRASSKGHGMGSTFEVELPRLEATLAPPPQALDVASESGSVS